MGFVHRIDPVFGRVWGVPLYYYGLAYAVGILGVYVWLTRRRRELGYSRDDVVTAAMMFALGVLLGGRLFAVFVYHWDYYAQHPEQILSCWRGGMASHGVLLGGCLSLLAFCRLRRKGFLRLADEVVVPAALLLALGRVGNFVNGQIVGTPSDLWWAVKFPGVEGFRHPVTLYEAAKNLSLIPILLLIRRWSRTGSGVTAANFVLWYGFLRIFTDLYRAHGAELFGIGRNQYFNAAMALLGAGLWVGLARRGHRDRAALSRPPEPQGDSPGNRPWRLAAKAAVLVALIGFSLTVRCAWTPEVLDSKRAPLESQGPAEAALLSEALSPQSAPGAITVQPIRARSAAWRQTTDRISSWSTPTNTASIALGRWAIRTCGRRTWTGWPGSPCGTRTASARTPSARRRGTRC